MDAVCDLKGKEIKRAALNDLSTYITHGRGVLTDAVYPEIIRMVRKPIWKRLIYNIIKMFTRFVDFVELISHTAAQWKSRLWSRGGRPDAWGVLAASTAGLRGVLTVPRVAGLSGDNRQKSYWPKIRFTSKLPIFFYINFFIYVRLTYPIDLNVSYWNFSTRRIRESEIFWKPCCTASTANFWDCARSFENRLTTFFCALSTRRNTLTASASFSRSLEG